MKCAQHVFCVSVKWLLVAVVLGGAGCGYIADKSRIKIATINGKSITRGDLEKVIREMSPDERPNIRTKGDVLKALQNYLDATLKNDLADKLREQGKLHVDRQIAEQVYRSKHPEEFLKMDNPQDYELTPQDLEYMKQEREYGIDEEVKRLEAEQAVYIAIGEAVQSGAMQVSDEEYQEEYELRKDELKHLEKAAFAGIVVPGSEQSSVDAAMSARARLAQGESLDAIAAALTEQGAVRVESGLENNPAEMKYAGFWQQASGAEPGTILGPIFIQGWVRVRQNAQGQEVAEPIPSGLLVCTLTDRVEPVQKSLEEAKQDLVGLILYSKMMDKLRKDANVQVFEDKLPDQSMYDTGQSLVSQSAG
ncbi:MAG: peptidyl-prolyl cis-trans isomerase [Candidatus Hydrogenedentes bacterium]|nr:peptidyl-prolyl cis-trans isomerase [Candidatus Hydrogenedentota bacterium]